MCVCMWTSVNLKLMNPKDEQSIGRSKSEKRERERESKFLAHNQPNRKKVYFFFSFGSCPVCE